MRHENTYWGRGLSAAGCSWGWIRYAGPALALSVAGFLVVVGIGCEEGIEEREVAKGVESVPESSERDAPSVDAPGDVGTPEGGGDAEPWLVPDGWERDPQERPMRYATFVIGDAPGGPVEVAVSRFPGDVGGVLASVNRWRGQVGLQPVGEGELDALLTRFGAEEASGYLLRLDGETSTMLASGIREQASDRTWFVRVTTTAEAADAVEDEVFGFARSMAERMSPPDDES